MWILHLPSLFSLPSPGRDRKLRRHDVTSSPPLPSSQAVIGNYAVPILEDKTVWGTTDETRTSYLDSQDVARMALAALR